MFTELPWNKKKTYKANDDEDRDDSDDQIRFI